MCDSHLNLPVEETEEARGGVWGGAKTGLDGSCGGETLPPGTEAVPTGGLRAGATGRLTTIRGGL